MKKIQITSDRLLDLTDEELKEMNVATMSCYINMGGKSYEDLIDITPDGVFLHLSKTGELAKTAAKSPDDYYNFFKPFVDEGKAVIHFSAASGISAIHDNSAIAAARLPDTYAVDTRSLCNGVALLVGYAIELIENGETDPKKIYDLCCLKREKLQDSFLVDTLECLYRGGRCSTLRYYAANILRIKPAVTLDKTNGKMIVREKCRGSSRRAIADYVANTFKKYPNPDLKTLYIIHYCKDEALIKFFYDTVTSYHKFENVKWGFPSCNCIVHSGPNTFGIFYFVK